MYYFAMTWTVGLLLTTRIMVYCKCHVSESRRYAWVPLCVFLGGCTLCALSFAWENGRPCLTNLKMDELSHQLAGGALLNANEFWRAIEPQPLVRLENGETWSFARVRLELNGRTVYQITGTNITEEARLQRNLEEDNLRLQAMNRRLRQYGQEAQEVTREKEILRAKTRVHDEIGRALLQTRQFLSGTLGDADSVCAAWRQNVRLLLGKYAGEQRADAFEQLAQAAQAIGVTIERRGAGASATSTTATPPPAPSSRAAG